MRRRPRTAKGPSKDSLRHRVNLWLGDLQKWLRSETILLRAAGTREIYASILIRSGVPVRGFEATSSRRTGETNESRPPSAPVSSWRVGASSPSRRARRSATRRAMPTAGRSPATAAGQTAASSASSRSSSIVRSTPADSAGSASVRSSTRITAACAVHGAPPMRTAISRNGTPERRSAIAGTSISRAPPTGRRIERPLGGVGQWPGASNPRRSGAATR